jgi:hypothetical protein
MEGERIRKLAAARRRETGRQRRESIKPVYKGDYNGTLQDETEKEELTTINVKDTTDIRKDRLQS